FPEEANRRIIDLLADALFAPTARARAALLAEGCREDRIYVVGNKVMDGLETLTGDGPAAVPERPEVLITVHRRESFGAPLQSIFAAVRRLAESFPDVRFSYPVHRNPNVRQPAYEMLKDLPNL